MLEDEVRHCLTFKFYSIQFSLSINIPISGPLRIAEYARETEYEITNLKNQTQTNHTWAMGHGPWVMGHGPLAVFLNCNRFFDPFCFVAVSLVIFLIEHHLISHTLTPTLAHFHLVLV